MKGIKMNKYHYIGEVFLLNQHGLVAFYDSSIWISLVDLKLR